MTATKDKRIAIIDGFRGLAILLVVLFHFFSRFAPPMHPENLYAFEPVSFPIIRYGFFGVHLFFVISGFVIIQSLERSQDVATFFKHRLIRLWPSMLACSVLTFFLVAWLDPSFRYPLFHPSTPLNFLPSLTFTPPEFWNAILGRNDISWIDGAYWSLWAEVWFYVVAGIVFWLSRRFLTTWLILTVILNLIRILSSPRNEWMFSDQLNEIFRSAYSMFFLFNMNYWVYFSIGIFVFALYSKNKITLLDKGMITLLILLEIYFLHYNILRVFFVGIIILMGLFLYAPASIRWLGGKIIVAIGLASYPLYLLHENVGMVLISKISDDTSPGNFAILIPMGVAFLVIVATYLMYLFYERPVMRYLRGIWK